MDFDFSFEQNLLRDQARKLFTESQAVNSARRHLDGDRQFDQKLWDDAVSQGWPAILVDEEHGGLSLGVLEACVLAEEAGRSLAPIPLEGSFLAAHFLGQVKDSAAADIQAKIAEGAKVSWFVNDGQVSISNGKLDGSYPQIVLAEHADYVLVIDGSFVALCAAGDVGLEPVSGIDATRPTSAASFSGTQSLVSSQVHGQQLLDFAAILVAFSQVGLAENCLDAARDYALERYAFGRPIGSYQAVKHKLADMYIALQLARSNCYAASWALTTDEAINPSLFVATAKVSSNEAADLASKEAIQLHGGIGFTWEVDRHLYYRRARLYANQARGAWYWQDRLVEQLRQKNAA